MKLLISGLFICLLAACNTMEGIGEDISGAGDFISDGAEDTKEKIKD